MNKHLLLLALFLFSSCGEDPILKEDPKIPIENPEDDKVLSFKDSQVLLYPNMYDLVMQVNTNVEYECNVIGDDSSWLNYSLSEGGVKLSVRPNNEEYERKVRMIVKNGEHGISDTIDIIQTVNKERVALIKIYKALNGEKWLDQENWCTDRPLSEWEGIMANGDKEVYRLWLSRDANVKGEIPECLGDLTNLEQVSCEYSNVSGRLPESIGKLTNLKRITIGNCKFEGEIPESIKNCLKLEYVDMSQNHFTGKIPEVFFLCENLEYLMLGDNKFNQFEINYTPKSNKLHTLHIYGNEIISPIPDNLFLCKGLRFIHAEDNKIKGHIPETIFEALNLEYIDLSNNELEGELPSRISSDSKLGNIDVSNNNLSGKIPFCYSVLYDLQVFNVTNNYLDIAGSDYIKDNPNYDDLNWRLLPQK